MLAASFLLLMVVFHSVIVALKSTVMNLLSIGAAYGVVVAVFRWGWLGGLIGLQDTYLIASPLPAIFFAVLFGRSMDYEVSSCHASERRTRLPATTSSPSPAGWLPRDASSPAAR
ncbi:hypothetical protein [Micromonospora sp. SL4-19]|uniref:hypothetical protein n=1 Tax=Micromonospora sp. SL4-19 TaxID=3399129 RepID=UPI003A4D8C24